MANTIQDFKSALLGGGARPNLFEVTIPNPPTGINLTNNFPILCKAANLPASNIASIDVPFRGRIFKVAGDRTFDTWSITIINDQDFLIRDAMENWMQKSDSMQMDLVIPIQMITCAMHMSSILREVLVRLEKYYYWKRIIYSGKISFLRYFPN